MKKTIFKSLRILLFLSLTLALLYIAFRGINIESLWSEFLHAKYIWILLSVILLTISHFIRAFRWNLLIEALHFKPSIKNTFLSVMVGYLANYVFPRIGEITRCGVLSRTEKIPADKLFGTVIVERAVDFITLIIFLFVLITAKFEFFSSFIKPHIVDPVINSLSNLSVSPAILLLLIFGFPVLFIIFLYLFRSWLSKWLLVRKLKDIVKGIISGLKTVYKMKRSLMFIVTSILIWLFYWMMTYVAFFALPSTSGLKIIDGLFILVIGGFAFVAPVQGGIGAFHWIVSMGLLLYGISKEEGLAFATIVHGSQALLTILLGTFSMLYIAWQSKRKKLISSGIK